MYVIWYIITIQTWYIYLQIIGTEVKALFLNYQFNMVGCHIHVNILRHYSLPESWFITDIGWIHPNFISLVRYMFDTFVWQYILSSFHNRMFSNIARMIFNFLLGITNLSCSLRCQLSANDRTRSYRSTSFQN